MSDEYIIEEEEAGGSSNRPFLLTAAALTTLLVLASACTIFFLLNGSRAEQVAYQATVSAIETQNAIVAVTNEAVTQTIAAMETEAARPTETPVPTNTTVPTSTPVPTNTATPVVAEVEAAVTETPVVDAGAVGDGETAVGAATTIPLDGDGEAAGGNGTDANGGSNNRNNTLPQTGIDTWQALMVAAVLVGVLLLARRLRQASASE